MVDPEILEGLSGLPLPDDLLKQVQEVVGDGEEIKLRARQKNTSEGFEFDGRRHLWLYETPKATKRNKDIVNDPNYYDRIPPGWTEEWANREITKDDYTPDGCPEEFPRDFVEFIMSMWDRSDKCKAYKQFWLYCEQARRWREEAVEWSDFPEGPEQEQFGVREMQRGHVNILYILDKYVTIKDDTQPGGRRKYHASTPQALLCFLKNIGVSYVVMKGRQAAITSTEMACAQTRFVTIPSYKGVLVTDDIEDTGKNIYGDKFKSTMFNMPHWWVPKKQNTVANSTERIVIKSGQHDTSEFGILPGNDPQSVNGMAPTDLYVDEGQNIGELRTLLWERRPSQMAEVGGEMRLVRQTFAWGTSASTSKGGGSLEEFYKDVKEAMIAGLDTRGWVSLFFDALCRPYVNEEILRKEYDLYMGERGAAKGRSIEAKRSMFAGHFPMSDEDTFARTGGDNMVSWVFIKSHRDRIIKGAPVITYGEFEEVYDKKKPMPVGSDMDFFVEGVKFNKWEDGAIDAPIRMFKDRQLGWIENYWQGTDPIQSASGLSRMGSVILAGAAATMEVEGKMLRIPAPVCIHNHRNPKVKESWKQTKLMGMYYANHGERACPELVEYNQGQSYIEWVQLPFLMLGESLVPRRMLPLGYQAGTQPYGADMKEKGRSSLHRDLGEFNENLAANVWYAEYFAQLSKIRQEERQTSAGVSVKWGTENNKAFNDDLVDAMGLAYVNMKYNGHGKIPRRLGTKEAPEYETLTMYVRNSDLSGYWAEVQVKAGTTEPEYVR